MEMDLKKQNLRRKANSPKALGNNQNEHSHVEVSRHHSSL